MSVPSTVGIVGLGLIGTSIALAVRRAQPDIRLLGVDRGDVITHPRVVDTFSLASTELAPLAHAGLIVLAAPVDAIIDLLPRVSAIASAATVVTDTGSTKTAIVRAARDAGVAAFVGGHPMAGAAVSGPDAARADLFDGRPWFLMGGEGEPLSRTRAFVESLGATPIVMADAGEPHDRLMAAISHLPQVVASALMARAGATAGEEGLRYAGAGLRDTTRLAESSIEMWASVLATNAEHVAPLLRELAGDLEKIAGALEDREALDRLFSEASRWRQCL